MTPYNEQEGIAFIFDCLNLAKRAKAPLNVGMIIFGLRMQFDAATGLSYEDSRTKHLHEMWEVLESQGLHSPEPPKYVEANKQPENIETTDREEVALRVRWWLNHLESLGNNKPEPPTQDFDLWMGYIFDTAGEDHKKGWTADNYWPDFMTRSYHAN